MVVVYCGNCGSEKVRLDGSEKYIICDDCKDEVYVRDLDIGLMEKEIG